jgi:hypothetical protein
LNDPQIAPITPISQQVRGSTLEAAAAMIS